MEANHQNASVKRLILLRHGEATPYTPDGDASRQLTAKGLREAQAIGSKLSKEQNMWLPQKILCSSAQRTQQTCSVFTTVADCARTVIEHHEFLKKGLHDHLLLLASQPEEISTLLLIGHNPTLSDIGCQLTHQTMGLNTANMLLLAAKGEWRNMTQLSWQLHSHLEP